MRNVSTIFARDGRIPLKSYGDVVRAEHVALQLVRTCKAYSYVTNGTEFWSITVVLADLLSVKCSLIMDSIIRNMSIRPLFSNKMKFV